jgi:hypothetical protein
MARGRPKRSVTKTSRRTGASRRPSPGRRAPALQPHVRALVDLAALAKRERLRWYVFGAQAVNLLGYPRATADLDITVDLGDRDPAELVAALAAAGFEPRFSDAAFIAATRVIPVVHRASKMPIDVVLAGPGLEQLFLDTVVMTKLANHQIPVLSIENLIVTKLIAGRPKDLEDVRELVARSGSTIDHGQIESVLALVEDALATSDLLPQYRRIRAQS